MQTHLGLTFYPAFNDQVLLYGKRTRDSHDMILVAVSLDPHNGQEATVEMIRNLQLPELARRGFVVGRCTG
ncbi:hypothetical protein B4Q13_16415 [Lacticaseibacillus rhamnosus]